MKQEILEIINSFPDISQFDIKDGRGNQIIDTGKHVIPGALIGVGIALYADTIKRKIPDFSTKMAILGTFLVSGAYETAEVCGDYVPNSHSILETCQKGFIDGSDVRYASMDTTADMFITVGFGAITALIASNALFAARRRFYKKPFYKMSESEEKDYLQMWETIRQADRKIIEIVPDKHSS